MKIYKGYKICSDGRIYNKDGSLKKLHKNNNGYYLVDIYENSVRKKWLLHRLIATLFIPNPQKEKVVNHIDGNKLNNHYSNLEWTNHSQNNKHAYKIGLKKPLSNPKFNIRLSISDVKEIKTLLRFGNANQAEIGRRFGVSRNVINNIKTEKTWGEV